MCLLIFLRLKAELVRSAFSGPDLEEEFRSFKNSAIEEELEIDTKKMKILKDGLKYSIVRCALIDLI